MLGIYMAIKLIKQKTGLRYLHIPNKSPMVSIGFIIKVGSRDENKSFNGISHFLEHMLFKGTKKRNTSKLLKQLDNLGSSYNAMTTYDFTFYELHGTKEDFMKLLDIFVDLFLGANLYTRDIEKERGVILEEYNMGEGDLDDITIDLLMGELFEGSSLSMPIIGNKKNIKKFSRKDLIQYRNNYYCPANTTFITMGDIDYKKVNNYLNKKIKFECNKFNKREHVMPVQEIPRLNITNFNMNQTFVLFGFHHNGFLHKKHYNLESVLLSTYLTSGSSSKLYDNLRTKNSLIYNCNSYNTELEDTSIFMIKCAVDPKNSNLVVEKILDELYKVRNKIISDIDLKKIKKIYINKSKLDYNDTDKLNYYAEEAVKYKKIVDIEDKNSIIKKITKKKIREMSKHIFRKDNLNLILVGKVLQKSKKKIIDLLDKWYYLAK